MSRAKKRCPCCGLNRVGPIKPWARMTAYVDESQNVLTSCIHCIREDDSYYAERWSDYYSDAGYPSQVKPVYRHGRRPPIPGYRGTSQQWVDELFRDMEAAQP